MPESYTPYAASNKYCSGNEAPKSVLHVKIHHNDLIFRGENVKRFKKLCSCNGVNR